MAPTSDRSAACWAWCEGGGGGTPGLHPRIVPLSVEKMNSAAPEFVPSLTTNPGPPLNTSPVGAPGTLTTSDCGVPDPSYSVDTSMPLSATHHGVPDPAARPHAFTRFGSVNCATPSWSETSLVRWYAFEPAADDGLASSRTRI